MKAMLMLHDPGERIAASLARLSSALKSSESGTCSCRACMKEMLMLHDPCERIAASLAQLKSVQKSSEQAHARAERHRSEAHAVC